MFFPCVCLSRNTKKSISHWMTKARLRKLFLVAGWSSPVQRCHTPTKGSSGTGRRCRFTSGILRFAVSWWLAVVGLIRRFVRWTVSEKKEEKSAGLNKTIYLMTHAPRINPELTQSNPPVFWDGGWGQMRENWGRIVINEDEECEDRNKSKERE